ncbi:MAG: Crp/Fnr family transcriptional regulator [Eubacterium sp.]
MKKYIQQLCGNTIFHDLTESEWDEFESLELLRKKSFHKGEILFSMGETASEIGIIIEGSVVIENNDIWGNSTILNKLETGDVFAETYAITGTPMMVDVVAAQACEIVFLSVQSLLEDAKNSSLSQKITRNLLLISMQKNLILSSRIFCTSPKTIRERLAIYFSEQVTRNGSTSFDLPFNRQQMADYLNLDRSALSKELGKMREEGLIRYRKNHFEMVKFHV